MMIERRTSTTTTTTRQPSQARIRKSITTKETDDKRVTWCPTEATVQQVPNHYEGLNQDTIWYTRDELRRIRVNNELTAADFTASNQSFRAFNDDNQHQQGDTMRGLESWTEEGSWRRYQKHRDCVNKVLDEQDRQKGIDRTHLGAVGLGPSPLVKRVNHLHIPFDHDRLGALSRDATAVARREALFRGRRDYLEMKECNYRTLSFRNNNNNLRRGRPSDSKRQPQPEAVAVEKKPTATSDEEQDETLTVQTETSTLVDGSHNDLYDNDESEVEPDEEIVVEEELVQQEPLAPPPIPSVISHPVTVESLQEKHRARYAAYLANRQARRDAQEKAEYEWEQRRMARAAELRKESDVQIAQMKNLMTKRSSLMARVTTTTNSGAR